MSMRVSLKAIELALKEVEKVKSKKNTISLTVVNINDHTKETVVFSSNDKGHWYFEYAKSESSRDA